VNYLSVRFLSRSWVDPAFTLPSFCPYPAFGLPLRGLQNPKKTRRKRRISKTEKTSTEKARAEG
jgi:hypothetical protein